MICYRLALISCVVLTASCALITPSITPPVLTGPNGALDIQLNADLYVERTNWLDRYYRRGPTGEYLSGKTGCDGKPCYNIIVATAPSKDAADHVMDQLFTLYPMAFQLWTTESATTPYAIVAGIGLPQQEAYDLAKTIHTQYPGLDARAWQWPKFAGTPGLNLRF